MPNWSINRYLDFESSGIHTIHRSHTEQEAERERQSQGVHGLHVKHAGPFGMRWVRTDEQQCGSFESKCLSVCVYVVFISCAAVFTLIHTHTHEPTDIRSVGAHNLPFNTCVWDIPKKYIVCGVCSYMCVCWAYVRDESARVCFIDSMECMWKRDERTARLVRVGRQYCRRPMWATAMPTITTFNNLRALKLCAS